MSKKDSRYTFNPPRDGDEDDQEYMLLDPTDFNEYLDLIDTHKATDEHHDEFMLRVIERFIGWVFAGSQHPLALDRRDEIEPWVLKYLANQFYKVVMGGCWEDEFPLPWTKASLPYTATEWRNLNIFCDVSNAVSAEPTANVTDLIDRVAQAHSVSYETARAAYYDARFLNFRPKT